MVHCVVRPRCLNDLQHLLGMLGAAITQRQLACIILMVYCSVLYSAFISVISGSILSVCMIH